MQKRRSPAQPRSTAFGRPLTRLATARPSRRGMPRPRAKSLAVPKGSTPRETPVANRAGSISAMVPSPPQATTTAAPSITACLANAVPWPRSLLNSNSTGRPARDRAEVAARAARPAPPPPAAGLAIRTHFELGAETFTISFLCLQNEKSMVANRGGRKLTGSIQRRHVGAHADVRECLQAAGLRKIQQGRAMTKHELVSGESGRNKVSAISSVIWREHRTLPAAMTSASDCARPSGIRCVTPT